MTADRSMSFDTPQPAKLRVNLPFGRITVTAEETQTTRVELSAPKGDPNAIEWIEQAEIVQLGDEIVVRGPKLRFSLFNLWGGSIEAVVHAPLGSDATLSIGAGRVETIGRMGAVRANTGAGNVHIAECAEANANTGAGNIDIAAVAGSVEAKTGAGTVRIGKVGANAEVRTAAGNTHIDAFAGTARLKTAHGNIEVGSVGDSLEAFTSSGNVRVTMNLPGNLSEYDGGNITALSRRHRRRVVLATENPGPQPSAPMRDQHLTQPNPTRHNTAARERPARRRTS